MPASKAKRLDDPANQDSILDFCRSCGRETYHGRHCWDKVCSAPTYIKYKQEHPEFAKKVKDACHLFYVVSLKENPNRIEDAWENITGRVKNGDTETRIFAEFEYKTDKNGDLILDPRTNEPIPEKLVGTAKQYVIRKPCPASLAMWLADKYNKISQQG